MKPTRVSVFQSTTWIIICVQLMLLGSCRETSNRVPTVGSEKSVADSIILLNRGIVTDEIQQIEDFIARYHWDMKKNSTGLRYMIYRQGTGPVPVQGETAAIRFSVTLLNGDQVFATLPDSAFTFEIGRSNVVNGLEEGILLMNRGSRAKFIIPSHLAFGLLGDPGKVPSRAVLVYDVELSGISQIKK